MTQSALPTKLVNEQTAGYTRTRTRTHMHKHKHTHARAHTKHQAQNTPEKFFMKSPSGHAHFLMLSAPPDMNVYLTTSTHAHAHSNSPH